MMIRIDGPFLARLVGRCVACDDQLDPNTGEVFGEVYVIRFRIGEIRLCRACCGGLRHALPDREAGQ